MQPAHGTRFPSRFPRRRRERKTPSTAWTSPGIPLGCCCGAGRRGQCCKNPPPPHPTAGGGKLIPPSAGSSALSGGFSLGKTTLRDLQAIITLCLCPSSGAHVRTWQHVDSQLRGLATCLLWPWQGWMGSTSLQKPPNALIPCRVLQQPNIVQVPGTSPIRNLVTQGKGYRRVLALPI